MRGTLSSLVVAALCGATLAGCTVARPDAGFSDVQKMLADSLEQRVEWDPTAEDNAEVSTTVRELLTTPLTADSAVQVALLNNRSLRATFEELGIAQADLVQAGLLRNPVFLVERRFSGQAAEIDLMQELVSTLTMPLRKRVAGASFEAAKLRVAAAVLDLAADVRSTYYTLQAATQIAAMRRHVTESSTASADLAQRMHDAGNISDLDLRLEQSLTHQSQLDLLEAEEAVIEERERMNALMGLWGSDTTWSMTDRLPALPDEETPLHGLESAAVARRLDLAAARQDIVSTSEALGLTKLLRWIPAGLLGFHYEHEPDGGRSSIGPSLELVLPVFDWGQGAVPRDRAVLHQKQQRYIALAVEIRSRIRAASSRMRFARSRAQLYAQSVLPLQTEILHHAQQRYNAMILGPLQLFQLKQTEIDAGRQSIEAQRDYWLARTELEHVLGGPIPAATPQASRSDPRDFGAAQ